MPQYNVCSPEKKIIIVGCSDFSKLMKLYLEKDCKTRVFAFCVESAYKKQQKFAGLPVLALEDLPENYPPFSYKILNAIGYRQMNRLRERIHRWLSDKRYELLTYIHPSATVHSPIGAGSIILENSSIGFRNSIGFGAIIWNGVVIAHDASIGNFTYWSPGAVCCGNVTVSDRCFIGANATLRNCINLAESTLVGAGVYMSRTVTETGKAFRAPYPQELPHSSDEIL